MVTKLKVILFLILIVSVSFECKNYVNEKFSFDRIYYYAIQEDVLKIVESLNSIPNDSLSYDQRAIKEKYISRFQTKSEKFDFKTNDTLIINTIKIFQNYWTDVLMKQHTVRESESKNGILISNLINSYSLSNAGETGNGSKTKDIPLRLSNLLQRYGYYSRIGRTGNILDLIIWNKQSKETYSMNMDDTIVNVQVVFIDSTITLGWEGYATFDHFYPGGWTGADTLYCIKKDYDINSEHFKVSYLAHETQHLLDHKYKSKVSGWKAEYRAKLAELSLGEKTIHSIIDAFIKGSKNDSHLTHPYAEYRLVGELSKEIFKERFVTDPLRWNKVSYQEINKISRKILKQNSLDLQ
jgi:hypothetical protein